MAKNKRRGPQDVGRVKTPADLKKPPTAAQLSRRGGRETMDALVVAFVLAFLIRTYVAEAFVIPTGSMAPTLMGQHKDVFCDQCGTRFKVNSSDDVTDARNSFNNRSRELEATTQRLKQQVADGQVSPQAADREIRRRKRELAQMAEQIKGMRCIGGECPQCRYLMLLEDEGTDRIAPEWAGETDQTADYSGDRLVVSKYAYSFEDPERWDVAVFKYPGNSQVNYIKRVTGLPGEELRIFQGDIYTRPLDSEDEFTIARKPPEQVMAMRQLVHDTDHQPASLHDAGWPLSWSGDGWKFRPDKTTQKSARGASVLKTTYDGEAADGETAWLRYHHLPPNENVWRRILGDGEKVTAEPKPQLITDFTPYNTRLNLGHAADNRQFSLSPRIQRADDIGRVGVHWVSDLMLEAELTIASESTRLSLDLVKGGDHYGVTIDGASGVATFWRQAFEASERETLATAETEVRAGAEHQIRLANIDSRLLLWIDGSLADVEAAYDTPQSKADGPAEAPRTSDADAGDLAPVGIGITGGGATVRRLQVWRDGYYFAATAESPGPAGPRSGFTSDILIDAFNLDDQRNWRAALLEMSSNQELWYALANRRRVDFRIEESQLFVMGDNSGWSLDARLWADGSGRDSGSPGGPYLERSQLVGKAVCVYWPHAWYSMPGTGGRLPVWPNFGDMRLVR